MVYSIAASLHKPQDLVFPIPANFGANKIVWLGKRPLSKYSSATAAIKGSVRDSQGKFLTVPGKVSISVRGTHDPLFAPLQNGIFHFDKVPPGDYRIQFQINHFSVALSDGQISPPVVSKDFVAVRCKHVTFRTPDGHQEEIEPSGNYGKTQFHNIEMDQSGNDINLCTEGYRMIVVKHTNGSSDNPDTARSDWYGTLEAGDDIVLLEPAKKKSVYDLKVVTLR